MLAKINHRYTIGFVCALNLLACGPGYCQPRNPKLVSANVEKYAPFTLTADLSELSDNQKQMIPLLIQAAMQMDHVFWKQAYGDKEALLGKLSGAEKQFASINYGPWDRLSGNAPFVKGVGNKPLGANFYPQDLTKEAFEEYLKTHPAQAGQLKSLYTIVVRKDNGDLRAIPYHLQFQEETRAAADFLRRAAELAENGKLRDYLLARSEALLTSQYQASDLLWMDMKDNVLDIVIGPIETYEDQLFGYKAAHEGYVLIKDQDWSRRLSKYADMLPQLQRALPVAEKYKKETPGTNSDLNAYTVIYYAGDCNAGSKTIAINLPNDEEVQLQKGTRRLQLKNAMRAKFDRILLPISKTLIVPSQRKHVTFDAFFENTMFHEVAHGLGIKTTITGKGTVREALREQSASLEEGKADVLGLFMLTQLNEQGKHNDHPLMDNFVTFLASVFRSVRFGASSAHGRANVLRFNFFKKEGAFTRTPEGLYRIHPLALRAAMEKLSGKILRVQGDGDYAEASRWMGDMGSVGLTLKADLERLNRLGIPVDVTFKQGMSVLGDEPGKAK